MKKHLIFAFMLMAVVAIQAQTVKKVNPTPELSKGFQVVKPTIDAEPNVQVPFSPHIYPVNTKGTQSLQKVLIGGSTNIFGGLVQSQTCLTYNSALDLILFTHRQRTEEPGAGGFIRGSFSTDGGTTWNQNVVYSHATADKRGRYPSGVIYNPSGNTDVNNAFKVVVGPYTDGTGWAGNYYASIKFDSTASDIKQVDIINPADSFFMVRTFMNIDNQGRVRVYGEKNKDDGQFYTSYTTAIMTGTFNSTTNSWDWVESIMVPDYTIGSEGRPDGYRTPGMAWSSDGETGYMVYVGRNGAAPDPLAFHPMVYKTTDAGATWDLLPGFDFSILPEINANLTAVAGPSGVKRASFSLIDEAVVDANGRLHFACMIRSAASSNPDSLGYMWIEQNFNGIIYHVWQTATGWDAAQIDVIWALDVDAANSPILGTGGSTNVGWDHRLQMSKTADDQHIVFAWSDTDLLIDSLNLAPDLFAQVYNINTGERTATKNITGQTPYSADNFFFHLSDRSGFDPVTNEVILHMTTTTIGAQDIDPVSHFYLKNARVFANVNEYSSVADGNLIVSQNYPNPFSGQTSIDITLKVGSDVTVEVYNMMGQLVSSNYYQFTAGTHTVEISGQNMNAGIYFYTVHTSMGTVTNKMIVK